MRQGNITLPVIYALEQPELRDDLLAEIRRIQDGDGQGDARKAVDMIKKVKESLKLKFSLTDILIKR